MKIAILTSTMAAAFFATASAQLLAQQSAPAGTPGQPGAPGAPSALPAPGPAPRGGASASSSPPRVEGQRPPSKSSGGGFGQFGAVFTGPGGKGVAIGDPLSSRGQATSASVPPLVIRFSPDDGTAVNSMEEDLAIMTRLLEKSLDQLGETPTISKLGLKLLVSGDKRSVRASYLEGFGALFMVKVSFPVFGATHQALDPAENQGTPKAESDWEKTKRELSGGGSSQFLYSIERDSQFDANAVSSFTKAIIQALTNGSNIRGLKPEEFIAVTVFGSADGLNVFGNFDATTFSGGPGGTSRYTAVISDGSGTASSRGSVLTVRVKRADVDALTKGEITPEQFQSRVTTHGYAGNGHGVTSLNRWVRGATPAQKTAPQPSQSAVRP